MCGIVGTATRRQSAEILIEGLQRLEYRGYDSAGFAVLDSQGVLRRERRVGKVRSLREAQAKSGLNGHLGIAHTRWATHGKPTEANAHPHSSSDVVAVVHNGIIENHESLRKQLQAAGYAFSSETDTEVIAHLVHLEVSKSANIVTGVQKALTQLVGAYAVAVIHADYPDHIIAARLGSPLVIGLGIGENFVASDPQALRPVTDRFIFLNEGEIVDVSADCVDIIGVDSTPVMERAVTLSDTQDSSDKGTYRHYMMKEIHEQPDTVRATLEGRVTDEHILINAFGVGADKIFSQVEAIQIVACGSSFYTGLVAKYWIEELLGLPCSVEIASEFRYREVAVIKGTLFVTISQSGETADTLAALRDATSDHYVASLCLCNVPNSSLVRESDLALMIKAGPEICVASTKAFTTQLVDLMLLVLAIGKQKGLDPQTEIDLVKSLHQVPGLIEKVLTLDNRIEKIATNFVEKHHALFLGRGSHFPIAMEGALKLKEVSYIHAEGYPAGELKHGPLALVDEDMPVVAVAPNDELLGKIKSNLEEVQARGGVLYVFGDEQEFTEAEGLTLVAMPSCDALISPIIYTVPMQLLAYHVAVMKGTDVDQPRNLAKSVTVE
ncbi:MAG: glucosamine--fructose-6-phosphate aminotransferase (isomerizing) [Patiriisocius sp.]|jgi:glucosamine--fructose-6-phosphate aminotransferase (isomerizing)